MISRHGRQTRHARSPGHTEVQEYNTLRLYVAARNRKSKTSFALGLNDPPHFLQTAHTTCLQVTTETAPGPTWLHLAVTAKQQLVTVIHLKLNSPEVLTTHTPEGGGVEWVSRQRKRKLSLQSSPSLVSLSTVHSIQDIRGSDKLQAGPKAEGE